MVKNQELSKEIWLRPDELERMLKGSLHWTDVAARLDQGPEKNPRVVSLGVRLQKPVVQKRFEGLKAILLLAGVALSTMVTWVYFVFYR